MAQPVIQPAGLTFPWPKVLKAVNEVRIARQVRTLFGAETGPGLWLVGDEGVYLMPNTTTKSPAIVYARECDPTKLAFETWWAKKRASFGGDDGVEFIPLTDIEKLLAEFQNRHGQPRFFHVEITADKFSTGFL
jgi:hypothetical protein